MAGLANVKRTVMGAAMVVAAAGLAVWSTPALSEGDGDSFAHLPASIELTGVVRDFKWKTQEGGHPDFEVVPTGGYGHYMNNISENLDSDNKPVFVGGGKKVSTQWRDAQNRNIHPSIFNASLGDTAGSYTGTANSGGISSAESFQKWFREVAGMNMSKPVTLALNREEDSNVYTFDDRYDPVYSQKGGFFPINNELWGNSPGQSKNYGFTFELATEFIYKPGTGQTFSFRGDDDVWVFINGKRVIDIGGVHSAVAQIVYLDRLLNLNPNQTNSLRFFFAERHTTLSNFRIETTINLKTAELPNTSNLYD